MIDSQPELAREIIAIVDAVTFEGLKERMN